MERVITPKRIRDSGRRKSLFGSCGVSPLSSPEVDRTESPIRFDRSPCSWAGSPAKASQLKSPLKTPVKRLENDFTQMALTRTPENRIGIISVRRSPRVVGVRPLSPDRGLITPKTFYGKAVVSQTDGKALYRTIRENVRVRLPMETIPREKKRAARSSDSSDRPKKQPRLRLFPDNPKLNTPGMKKLKSPKSAEAAAKKQKEAEAKKLERKALSEKKKLEKRDAKSAVYNWQFFNSKTPPPAKVSRLFGGKSPSVLTPPPTSKKRKLISSYDLDHLSDSQSPKKLQSPRRSPRKHPTPSPQKIPQTKSSPWIVDELPQDVREIANDFSDGDSDMDGSEEDVDQIIDNLNKDIVEALGEESLEVFNGVDENIPPNSIESSCETKRFYPVFNPNHDYSKGIEKPRTPEKLKTKRPRIDKSQLLIDAGQSNLREVECKSCGLFYVAGDDADEAVHANHHASCKALTFTNWKNGRYVSISSGFEKVVLVKTGDRKAWWDKAKEVLEIADLELGCPREWAQHSHVYMYIKKKMIVGLLAARPLSQAHRLLPNLGVAAELCTEEQFPVKVGISRLWVHPGHRKLGIATTLVDSLRRNYTYGDILKIDDIAFSAPTEDGKKFAAKYCRREDYLIYTFDA